MKATGPSGMRDHSEPQHDRVDIKHATQSRTVLTGTADWRQARSNFDLSLEVLFQSIANVFQVATGFPQCLVRRDLSYARTPMRVNPAEPDMSFGKAPKMKAVPEVCIRMLISFSVGCMML